MHSVARMFLLEDSCARVDHRAPRVREAITLV